MAGKSVFGRSGAHEYKQIDEFVIQATLESTTLATFNPTPPRQLTLQPSGHRLSDHIMISLVIIMREHLTPLVGMRGDAAQLFNYSPHHHYRED